MTVSATHPIVLPSAPDVVASHPVRAILATARPHQWIKNGLLYAGPMAAGVIGEPDVLLRVSIGLLSFTAAAVGTYFINDAQDVAADRAHPVKRFRPIAAGELGVGPARIIGVAAFVLAGAVGALLGLAFLGVLASYLLLTVAYSMRLKHVAILDITCVAAGFLLRAIAGCVAAGIMVSNWFLLVSFFGALLLVTGKRQAELRSLSSTAPSSRASLADYPADWLAQVHTLALTASVMSYGLWALQSLGTDIFRPALAVSVLPFSVALLRYSLLIAQGNGEAPERLLLGDRFFLSAAAVCGVLLVVGIYAA